MNITDFFKKLHAKLNNQRWSWGAMLTKDARWANKGALVLRVWYDGLVTVDGQEHITVLHKNRGLASPGHSERQRHIQMMLNGTPAFGVLCQAEDINASPRVIKSFNNTRFLRLGKPMEMGDVWLAPILGNVEI